MSSASKHAYRIKEFSALTGVSVRALHHYDRLGLLQPRRGTSGYRIYGADVAVLLALDERRQAALEADLVALLRSLNRGRAVGLVVPGAYLETVITK